MRILAFGVSLLVFTSFSFVDAKAPAAAFTPLERILLLSAVMREAADGSVMLPSAGREAPVLTGFTGPTEQIRPIVERAKITLENPELSDKTKRRMIRELFLPEFDTRGMAQRVLAQPWWGMYQHYEQEFIEAFADFFERKFSAKMELLKGAEVAYENEKIEGEYAEVKIRLITVNRGEFSIKLKMRYELEKWKIYDFHAFGKSAIRYYRDEVNIFLSRHSFEDLLENLKKGKLKIAPLSEDSRF